MSYLIIFVGGGIGAALRHVVNRAALTLGTAFPFGTFLVNVLGSFLMGVVAVALLDRAGDQNLRLFLATGMLGGFTTFSAFSLDTALLWERGEWQLLGLYVTSSVLLSVGSLFLGMVAGRSFG